MPTFRRHSVVELTLPGLIFLLLGVWSYALFIEVPYAGFDFNPSDNTVTVVYDESSSIGLQVGDQLHQVGTVEWQVFRNDLRQALFVEAQAGQVVSLSILRENKQKTVDWVYPGFTLSQFLARLNSEWWLAYLFWLVGTVTFAVLRPKDERWRQLVAFNYLTALWLAGGGTLPRWHVWEGAIKLRVLIWLCVPVYLHLHWFFPQPLGKLPRQLSYVAYLVAGFLILAEFFQYLPAHLYLVGVLVAWGGSLLLLGLHFWYQPAIRSQIMLLVGLPILAFLPGVALGMISLLGVQHTYAGIGLLCLPLLPLSYLYVATRRQLGNLELRANRLISLYIFLLLLSTAALILLPLLHAYGGAESMTWTSLTALVFTALLAITSFPPFERWFERRVLRMPLPPEHLLENYSSEITTSLSVSSLLALLEGKILASLLVRQAVLLNLNDSGQSTVLGSMGIEDDDLPTERHIPKLLSEKGASGHRTGLSWVQIILPLQIGEKTIGFWLLGRRDPDDYYAQRELAILQAIANQTAIALTNIVQATRLRTLYQSSIERQESERTALARELHDVVLNDLGMLYSRLEEEVPLDFEQDYYDVTERLRQIVKELRPPMLAYGLRTALNELADDLSERVPHLAWQLEFSQAQHRYPRSVELHLFRIVQQACENALHHAQAQTITLSSRLQPTLIELAVCDDGIGFESAEALDLTHLLSQRHFGLVGLWERAELVGAVLQIESKPDNGTQVRVTWIA